MSRTMAKLCARLFIDFVGYYTANDDVKTNFILKYIKQQDKINIIMFTLM